MIQRALAAALISAQLLSGCALGVSGWKQFYIEIEPPEAVASTRVSPPPESPEVVLSDNMEDSLRQFIRKGLLPVGYSTFTSGGSETRLGAAAQGRAVGADSVLVARPRYLSSNTTSVPITLPTTSTSQTTSNRSASGSGGTATVQGNSTTTTYGSTTRYVPITVNRFEYSAIYFVKRKLTFGAVYRETTDEERRQIGSNRGVVVTGVVDGGAAYAADILPEDLIVDVDSLPVAGVAGMSALLEVNKGKVVTMSLLRRGGDKLITKTVRLPL